jgi:hypothetical protein
MKTFMASSAALLAATVGVVVAAERLESGLQVGEKTTAYNVRDITGPNQGKTLCYR